MTTIIEWTTQPTVEGWYWYRQDETSAARIVYWSPTRHEQYGQWAGPLEEPK